MASMHILVAEDEDHTRLALSIILKKAGYTVSKARDGFDALKIMVDSKNGTRPVDLLLTDIQMSGLTGGELIAELDGLNISLPVLLITGYVDQDFGDELNQKYLSGVIKKPFDAEELIACITRAFKKEAKESR